MHIALTAFFAVLQLAIGSGGVMDIAGSSADPSGLGDTGRAISMVQYPSTPQIDGVVYGPDSPFSTPSTASSSAATTASVSNSMRAQMDVFSGRPNPSWDLSSSEVDQIRSTFGRLPERQAAIRSDSLGYRGVILQGDTVRDMGFTRISIGGGVVVAEGSQGTRYFSDSDRSLERLVFTTARGRIDATDYAAFKSIAFP
jgi:hypothetical protein